MSHYRALIEKLSVRHVERDDFEELSGLANEALNELSAQEREDLEAHAKVVAAAALSQSNGNAKGAVATLKGLERQLAGSAKLMSIPMQPLPFANERIPTTTNKRRSFLTNLLYVVFGFVLFVTLMGLLCRRC